MLRALSIFVTTVLLGFAAMSPGCADGVQINRISGNGGTVESAHLTSYDGNLWVAGRVKCRNSAGIGPIHVRVDLKDAAGTVLATATAQSYRTGRPQIIATFGTPFAVSFDPGLARKVAVVDVTLLR